MALEVPKYKFGITCRDEMLSSGPFTKPVAEEWIRYCNNKFPDCSPHRLIIWKERKRAREKKSRTNSITTKGNSI